MAFNPPSSLSTEVMTRFVRDRDHGDFKRSRFLERLSCAAISVVALVESAVAGTLYVISLIPPMRFANLFIFLWLGSSLSALFWSVDRCFFIDLHEEACIEDECNAMAFLSQRSHRPKEGSSELELEPMRTFGDQINERWERYKEEEKMNPLRYLPLAQGLASLSIW